MSETGPIAEIADRVSKELFKWFKWERVPLKDRNFGCLKKQKHAPTKKQEHTHPVDIVFTYHDPYLNTTIIFNTDLKSYKKTTITPINIRGALKSLAQTIDCARVSPEWRQRYDTKGNSEIRGLLFVYNHDAEYDDNFQRFLNPSKQNKKDANSIPVDNPEEVRGLTAETLPLEANQLIHIIEPKTVSYMATIVADIDRLHASGKFPKLNYHFFYPDLKLHKTHSDKNFRPATIEMICGPFFVVEHDEVIKYDEIAKASKEVFGPGYIIYYNRPGNSHLEFMYLFDVLSGYQILDGSSILRIRVAHSSPNLDIRSNYRKAIEMYIHDWGFDEYKKSRLEDIELEIIEFQKSSFSRQDIGWEIK